MTTNTFDTTTNGQACSANTTEYRIDMPCAGSNASVALSTAEPTVFNFGLADITGMSMMDGMLVITFADQQTLTVENFQEAMTSSSYQNIRLSDGEVINVQTLAQGLSADSSVQIASLDELAPAAGEDFDVIITKPVGTEGNVAESFSIEGGRVYNTNFTKQDIQSTEVNGDGQLVITFNDGTKTIIENYSSFDNAAAPQMSLEDGTVINVEELLVAFSEAELEAEQGVDVVEVQEETVVVEEPQVQIRQVSSDEVALLSPEELAEIEVAAGTPVGALGNTGAGFGSSVSNIGLAQIDDIGPIGPTSLAFDRPDVQEDIDPTPALSIVPPTPQNPTFNVDDAFGYEDTGINFGVNASPFTNDGSQYIIVQVSGIPSGWTAVTTDATTARGQYNNNNGTWTIRLNNGESLVDAPVFRPPLNSDADIPTLTATVTQYAAVDDSVTGSATGNFSVIVDAVADPTDLSASDVTGTEDNPVALNIQVDLQDLDGSEEITQILITNIPDGFTLNGGAVNQGAGVWSVPLTSLPNLQLTPTADYSGTLTLGVQVVNEETQLSGTEFDFTNNENTNSTTFNVTFEGLADAPSVGANNPIVKEDGSIDLEFFATLQDQDGSEQLTVTVSNIDTSWGVDTNGRGTYDAVTGTWTITLPAGESFDGALTFTPPANSDLDMNDIRVSAYSTELSTNTNSQPVFVIVDVITDAVADMPTLDAGADSSVRAGNSVALNISNNLTDTDGSEVLSDVTISGVPQGYTLSAGTNQGNGVWVVSQADLNGLMLNTPANANGTVSLSVSVSSIEQESSAPLPNGGIDRDPDGDGNLEVDNTDNVATNTDTVVITVSPDTNPPEVTFGANASGEGQVLEDNSVFVPITATLQGNASQQLTVTLTGVPADWGIETGPNNGTYNSATGTWTITLAPNTDYSGGLTFTPPADSDVDLTGLTVTASARNTTTNDVLTNDTSGRVIVDAVADTPDIDAGTNSSVTAGSSVAINITNDTTDVDGSESLGPVTISGVPTGYSLSAGVDQGNGTYIVQQSDLAGLRLNTPANGSGTVTLTASVTATEVPVSDIDFRSDNDTATNSDTVVITINPPLTPPEVTFGANASGEAQVLEDNSIFVPITATLTGNAQNQQLTVELTGVPGDWTVQTGSNNGTYNSATGTWTITLAPNTNYTNGLTFTPPADSDVDLTGLTVTATSTNLNTNDTEMTTTDGQVIVDAVADMPTLTVNNVNGREGSTIDLNISAALRDTDGSEVLSDVTISGVPSGFSLTAGTDQGNGVWTVTQAQLNGLAIVTPQGFSGSVPLTASVTSDEDPVTDVDFRFDNNQATNTKQFNVVISDTANPPTITVAGTHQVLEDNSVFVPFEATLTGDNSEILTVTVSNVPAGWTVTTGPDNGTYNSATGTWTFTLPAGEDYTSPQYTGGLTFAPPADSDIDLKGLRVSASAFAPETNTRSTVTEIVQIEVDAVADMPTIDAGSDQSVTAGDRVDLNITNNLTDTDGSEVLTAVTISGIPDGYSLSAGTNQGNGVWTVPQSQLGGLQLITPANATSATLTLNVSVTSRETVSDSGEFILTNNTATNSDTVVITVDSDLLPPTVTFGANGSGEGQVLEDNEVGVPITATLQGTADQQLTVTVEGLDPTWGYRTPGQSPSSTVETNGTITLTYTLPQNTDLNTVLFFAPPADSDVDLTGITVTATSNVVGSNETLSSSTNGQVIVDAVADMPTLTTQDVSGEQGQTLDLDISASLTDTDGSEVLSNVTISGVPQGFTLTAGTNQGNGVWTVTQAQLNGLGINVPNNATSGVYNLNISVRSTEQVTDTDFNFNNNEAVNNQGLTVTVSPDDVPVIMTPNPPISLERDLNTPNVITGTITVDYGNDGPGEVCVPQNGVFSANGALANNTLSHLGTPITVTTSGGNTYTGMAGNITIFTLVVQASGAYTFTQFETIDHASPNDPNEIANLNFEICARDDDGDMSVSTLTVRVQDTGPILRDDSVTLWTCDFATLGNAFTGYNENGNGADTLSVEDPNTIVDINGQAFKDGGDAMVIKGTSGFLFMFKDGAYAYVSNDINAQTGDTDQFTYSVRDGDGDISTASLTVNVIKAGQTSNATYDYGNQIGRANYHNSENNETNIYQTQNTEGAMVFGFTANDELSGNRGDDILFGWEGNDTLYGRAGNDVLQGEQGANTLYGGADADIFVIAGDKAGNTMHDTIMDFSLTEGDVISLGALIPGTGITGNISDYVRIEMVGNDAMIQVDETGSGNNFHDAALIKNHAGIDTSNLDVQQLFNQGHIDVT